MSLITLNTPDGIRKFLKDRLVTILKRKLSNTGKEYRSLSNNIYYINLDDTHLLLMHKTTDNDNVLDNYDIEYDETDATYYLKFTNDDGTTYVDVPTLYTTSPTSLDDIHCQVVDCTLDYVDLDSVQSIPGEKTFNLQKLNTAINDTGTNKFIVMDGNGQISPATMTLNDFNVAVGTPPDMSAYLPKDDIFRGNNNVFVGGAATGGAYCTTIGPNSTTDKGSAIAVGSAAQATNSWSMAIGVAAQATGVTSIAVGRLGQAAAENTVAIGHNAQATGEYSLAAGSDSTTSANYAIAIGHGSSSTHDSSIAIGYTAWAKNDFTIAIGRWAGANGPGMGDHSIAIGRSAGAEGAKTIAMGYLTEATANNAIAIGNSSQAKSSSSISIGVCAGKQVTTSETISLSINDGNGDWRGTFIKCAMNQGDFKMLVGCLQKNVDTELSNTSDQLKVWGNIYATGNVSCIALTQRSDERLKTDIGNLSHYSLKDILKLRPVKFRWKDIDAPAGEQYGLIAQEVEAIIPELVDNSSSHKSLKYISLIPMLVKCIQEQNDMIQELKAENDTQNDMIQELINRVNFLENK